MFLQDPPGYWSRRGALPKEGIAVTSLKGAGRGGRGVLQAKEGFSPLGGLIYACHTACMTRRYTIHQRSLQTLLPQLNLAKIKSKTGKGWITEEGMTEKQTKMARQWYLCPNQLVNR